MWIWCLNNKNKTNNTGDCLLPLFFVLFGWVGRCLSQGLTIVLTGLDFWSFFTSASWALSGLCHHIQLLPRFLKVVTGTTDHWSTELVWCLFILIKCSGHACINKVWDSAYFFGPDSLVEPGISAHIWSLHSRFQDPLKCTRHRLLEGCPVDMLVNADGLFLLHPLADNKAAFLFTLLLCGSHSARPRLEKHVLLS